MKAGLLLKNMNAIITGCNRGIGKEILRIYAENGANIWACVRSQSDEFARYIEECSSNYGVEIWPVYFDLKDTKHTNTSRNFIHINKVLFIFCNIFEGFYYVKLYRMVLI